MPIYNGEEHLQEAVASVMTQTHQLWELLIIDDASTDRSSEKILAFKDKRIRFFQFEENMGAGIARNKGIAEAKGRYIAFLDADDTWSPEKLNKQLNLMAEINADFCYSSYKVIGGSKKTGPCIRALPKVDYDLMLRNNYIGCLTAIYDTMKLGKVYMPESRMRQDWGLWMRLLRKTDFAYGIQEPLATYRKQKDSLSSKKLNLLKVNYQFYRDEIGLGPMHALLRMTAFLFYYFHYKMRASSPCK